MAWFKVDDGFYTSPKVLSIPRAHRFEAIGAWLLIGTWSADKMTDGVIPTYILEEYGCADSTIAALVLSGLWDEVPNGVLFHDWNDYQPTREQLEAKSVARAKAGMLGGTRSGEVRRSKTEANRSKVEAKLNPEPEPEPEPIKNLSKNDLFDSFWETYPKRSGKGKARESWLKAIKKSTAQDILDAAKAYAGSKDLPEFQFIPMPATWLNQERWNDDIAPAVKASTNVEYNTASLYCRQHGFPKDDCYKCAPDYQDVE